MISLKMIYASLAFCMFRTVLKFCCFRSDLRLSVGCSCWRRNLFLLRIYIRIWKGWQWLFVLLLRLCPGYLRGCLWRHLYLNLVVCRLLVQRDKFILLFRIFFLILGQWCPGGLLDLLNHLRLSMTCWNDTVRFTFVQEVACLFNFIGESVCFDLFFILVPGMKNISVQACVPVFNNWSSK